MALAPALAQREKAADRHSDSKAADRARTIELGWGRQRLSAVVPPGGNAEAALHSLMLKAMKNERGPEKPPARLENAVAGPPASKPDANQAPKLSKREQELADSNATPVNFFGAGSLMLESRLG